MKKSIIAIFCCFFCLIFLGSCKTKDAKDKEILTQIGFKDYDKARSLAYDYYKNDKTTALGWILAINGAEDKDYLPSVMVEPGWTWTVDNGYSYIKGRIRNYGKQTIRYFEVTASFYGKSNQILDTDYTNSGQDVVPGARKTFEIMAPYSRDYSSASLEVTKVSLKR